MEINPLGLLTRESLEFTIGDFGRWSVVAIAERQGDGRGDRLLKIGLLG